jgi:hypothetical protein
MDRSGSAIGGRRVLPGREHRCPNDFITNPGAAGHGGFDGRSSLFVIKTDSEGGEIWSRAYDTGGNVIS